MRRVHLGLSAAALLAALAAAVWLLAFSTYSVASTTTAASGPVGGASTEAVPERGEAATAEVGGPRIYGLLAGLVILAGLPLAFALGAPRLGRPVTWALALTLAAFSVLAGFSVGLFFLPAAGLLLLAAVTTLFHEPPAVAV